MVNLKRERKHNVLKNTGKYDDLLEEAKKHEEEAEQAVACAKNKLRAARAAVAIARATRRFLEEINN